MVLTNIKSAEIELKIYMNLFEFLCIQNYSCVFERKIKDYNFHHDLTMEKSQLTLAKNTPH